MAVERELLGRWKHPRFKKSCDGSIIPTFPSGRPPFAPLPTVTHLLNANLCPVAILHDLIHGVEDALLTGRHYPLKERGELFHKFIAYLKLSLKNGSFELRGDISSQLRVIRSRFNQFSLNQGFSEDASNDIWRLYVEPWVTRKLQNGELQQISSDTQAFFELTVANFHIPFPINSRIRNYPLTGRIDEIDLTNRRIIERTIRGESSDTNPPLLKDYQVWLLWKILCSLREEQIPPDWTNVNFQDFKLIVETPYKDFLISSNPINPRDGHTYVMDTHYAYAWINDICFDTRVHREAREHRCAPENPDRPECGHLWINCLRHNYLFPRSRPEIRRTFAPWCRFLLWEQIWKGIWYYQVLMLSMQDLLNLGMVIETQIISSQNNRMELEVVRHDVNTLRGYESCTIIPYGTTFCGLKLNARLTRTDKKRIFLEVDNTLQAQSEKALLLLSPDAPFPIVKEEPLIFLDRQIQSSLFRLEHIGTDDEDRARRRSLIQLLEAVFGSKTLWRERR